MIYRPVAKVVFHGLEGRAVTQLLYVDSGADHTVLPYRLGKYLRLNQMGGEVREIHGISGAVGVIYVRLEIELAGARFTAPIAWAQLEEIPPLLGRTDVFDRFEITFKQASKVVLFQPLKNRAS
ncbi:MAG: hypothetical protein HYZ89_05620 [Candidatus Omnitrophica bacterium]|nr:hypothetical protein [Candidatus Omnitrophota bacterium]